MAGVDSRGAARPSEVSIPSPNTLLRAALAVAAVALVILTAPVSIDAAPPAPSADGWGREAARADTKTACIYTRNDLRLLAAFQRRVGREFSCALVFNDAAPVWKGWVEPWVQVHPDPRFKWADWVNGKPGRRLVLTQSLVPASVPSDWRRRGARGEYDRYAKALARNLIRKGLGNTIIRLSHEMNGDWYRDHIGYTVREHRDWARYWARIVRIMRKQPGAHFLFDWNIAAGYRPIPFDQYYPGDDVVDIVGIDFYDYRFTRDVPAAAGAHRWRSQYAQPGGLGEAIAFAKAHGKPISLPEWGLAKRGRYRGGLGDNPDFVRRIATVVRDNPTVYQAYFECPTGDTKQLRDAPRSRAVYRGTLLSRTSG